MCNTCVISTLTLKCRESASFSCYDHSYCSTDRFGRYPLAYSSSLSSSCCSCCANAVYSVPICPTSLYGLRQSTLIQCKKLFLGGLDRYYSRFPAYDVDRECYNEKVCSFKENGVSRRGGKWGKGRYKCLVFEEKSDGSSVSDLDEAEVMLSLLTEDVDEELFGVRERNRRSSKRIEVDKRKNGGVDTYAGMKKRDESGIIGSKLKYKYESEVIPLRKEENRREEERASLLRRVGRKTNHKEEERTSLLRESQRHRASEEERENLSRNENHRQRLRKDGSSCSSYYSVSSTGALDSDSETQIENNEGNSKSEGVVQYDGVEEKDQSYTAGLGIVSRKDDNVMGLYGVGSDWRKKSEKRLTDISVEQTDSRKESIETNSRISRIHGSNSEKVSGSSQKYDDAKQESTSYTKIDGQTSQHRQAGKSNTQFKHKQFVDTDESHDSRSRTAHGSRKSYGEIEENSSEAMSRIQQAREEYDRKVESIIREDEYKRRSNRLNQQSVIQQSDFRRESAMLRVSDTEPKKKESNKHDHVSQLTKVDVNRTHVSHGKSEKRLKNQEDNTSVLNKSSVESKESSQDRIRDVRSAKSVVESHERTTLLGASSSSTTHYGDTSTVEVTEANKRERKASSEVLSGSSSIMESKSGVSSQDVSESSMQRGTSDFTSCQDALATVDRLQKFSSQYVGEFVEKAMHEISSSEILKERKTSETKLLHEGEQHSQKVLGQYAGDSQLNEQESRKSSLVSGGRGPSDEMWDVTEPSVLQEPPDAEVSEDSDKDKKAVVKRSGRSLWNIIGDIVHLRWMSRSGRNTLTSKSGGRSSPNQSTSSGTWFSGHEAEDNNDESSKGKRRLSRESSSFDRHQIVRSHGHGEASSSSSSKDHMKVEASSPSIVLKSSSPSETIPLPSAGYAPVENLEGTSGPTVPAIMMRSSPIIEEITEAGPAVPSSSVKGKAVSTILSEVSGPEIKDSEMKQRRFQRSDHLLKEEAVSTEVSGLDVKDAEMKRRKFQRSDEIIKGVVVSGEVSGQPEVKDAEMKQREFQRSDELIKGAAVSAEVSGRPEVTEAEMKRRKFQRSDQFMTDRFDEWEEAYKLESEQLKIDEMFMREALVEARKAADNWEVPVGAVLVHDGRIVARGCNLVEELRDSTAHAEMLCIREASNMLRTWRLSGTTLYVTLEPCPMCAGAILQARIDTVIWGAPNKLLGADGSWIRLFPDGDGGKSLEPRDKPPAPVHPFHPKITIRRGVLASECADVMQQFFQLRRKKKDKKSDPPTPPSCLPISSHQPKFLSKIHDVFHIMFCL